MRIIEVISRILAITFLILIGTLTTCDVIGRYVLNMPIPSSFEMTEVFLASLVGISIVLTTIYEKHIEVDTLFLKFNRTSQHILEIVANLLFFIIALLITWRSIITGLESIKIVERSGLIQIPVYPFRFILTFGFALVTTILIIRITNLIRNQNPKR